jgi:hypothetical protein
MLFCNVPIGNLVGGCILSDAYSYNLCEDFCFYYGYEDVVRAWLWFEK